MFVVVGTVDFRAPHLRTRLNGLECFLDKRSETTLDVGMTG